MMEYNANQAMIRNEREHKLIGEFQFRSATCATRRLPCLHARCHVLAQKQRRGLVTSQLNVGAAAPSLSLPSLSLYPTFFILSLVEFGLSPSVPLSLCPSAPQCVHA